MHTSIILVRSIAPAFLFKYGASLCLKLGYSVRRKDWSPTPFGVLPNFPVPIITHEVAYRSPGPAIINRIAHWKLSWGLSIDITSISLSECFRIGLQLW